MHASQITFAAAAITYERARLASLLGPEGLANEIAWSKPQAAAWAAFLAAPASSVDELDFRLLEAVRHAGEYGHADVCGELDGVRAQLLGDGLEPASLAVLIDDAAIHYERAGMCAEGLRAAARDARALAHPEARLAA